MDLAAVRELVLDVNADVLGVDIRVGSFEPGGEVTSTRAIWVRTPTDLTAPGLEFQRAARRFILAIKRADVPKVKVGMRIVAPHPTTGTSSFWRVDGTEQLEHDHQQVVVTPIEGEPVPESES